MKREEVFSCKDKNERKKIKSGNLSADKLKVSSDQERDTD
jgi:hypothetical protein